MERARRLRLLLHAFGWDGPLEEVIAAARRRASENFIGLRAAATDGYAPTLALVAEGVADDFERAVEQLDADTPHLLGDPPANG